MRIGSMVSLAAALLALAGLSGCSTVQPVLSSSATADPAAGYVAGLFSRTWGRGYGFVVRSVDGGAEFVMPLGQDTSLPTSVPEQTVAVRIPPGRYTVSDWITYATMTKEVMSRKPVTNPALSQPFEVKAGAVVHLGGHDVSQENTTSYPRTTTHMRIAPRRLSEADVRQAFQASYPNLATLPFRCVLCTDTVGQPR